MERAEVLPIPSLSELLAQLADLQSTCVIGVESDERSGEIGLAQGEVVFVRFGDLSGARAMLALLTASDLRIQSDPKTESIALPLSSLDLESSPLALEPTEPYSSAWDSFESPVIESPAATSARPSLEILPEPTIAAQDDVPPYAAPSVDAPYAVPSVDAPYAAPPVDLDPVPEDPTTEIDGWMSAFGDFAPKPPRPSLLQLSLPPLSRWSVTSSRWLALLVAAPLALLLLVWTLRDAGPSSAPAAQASAPSADTTRAPALIEGAPIEVRGTLAPTVLLRVNVGVQGRAVEARVAAPRAGLEEFETHALENVKRYRFLPALKDGQAVEQWITLPVYFVLAGSARELWVKGSDTIGASLAPSWARAFQAQQPRLRIQVEALGSSTGFSSLFDGSASVATASRPIRSEELAFAHKLGIALREVTAGYDGIAVIVHKDNRLRELSLEDVARIFAQRSTRWGEVGGRDAHIRVLGRPAYSGTHAFFKERVLQTLGRDTDFGASVEHVESTKEIVEHVAQDIDAIGYVSLGQVSSAVRVLAIAKSAGEKALAPAAESVRDGSYPIARPLFLYFRSDSDRDARAFLDFALSPVGQALVEKSGFVSLSSDMVTHFADEPEGGGGVKPSFTRVFFEPRSAVVPSTAEPELRSAAVALKQGRRGLIIGHADSRGDGSLNARLAGERAAAVAARLKQYGSGAAAIELQVASAEHPLASNSTADGRRVNRRVDVIVLAH